MPILNSVAEMQDEVAGWRRELHRNPELGFDVFKTAGFVDAKLREFGCDEVAGKIGIDATAKGPDEGRREWPPEIEMSPDIRARVDARWAEFGLGAAPSDADVQNGARARTLTQLLRR